MGTYRRVAIATVVALAAGAVGQLAVAATTGEPGLGAHVMQSISARRPHLEATRLASDLEQSSGTDPVHVLVTAMSTATSGAAEAAVAAHGGQVMRSASGMVDALVPAAALRALSNDPAVDYVANGRQYRPTAGTITSTGVNTTGAKDWLTSNPAFQGANVNVAIIDAAGFQGYDTELGDELPPSVTTRNFCGPRAGIVDSNFTADPHGTEIAAIVHDMAPAASISLVCAANGTELVDGATYVRKTNHDADPTNDISIVVGPFDDPLAGTTAPDYISRVADDLRVHEGVLWIAPAGNEADVHNRFVADGPDLDTPFGPVVRWAAPDNYEDGFYVQPGQTVDVQVKWDQILNGSSGVSPDFDMIVVDLQLNVIASSMRRQLQGNEPWEEVFVTNSGAERVTYFLAIIRAFAPTNNPTFDSYLDYADSELVNPVGSITWPGASKATFAAGATCVSNGKLEPYSGRGPSVESATKPDIVAPDGTSGQVTNSTDPYGPSNRRCTSGFRGTSAAAAHLGGAAALVKGAYPSFDADDIQNFIECRATDAGAAGPDSDYGTGQLTMGATPPNTPTNLIKPAVIRGNTIFLRNSLCTGLADISFDYGAPGDTIIMCDWDGNGTRTPAAFRNGTWYLRNASGPGYSDVPAFRLGDPGDIPVCGHWIGAGTAETAGVFRNGVFFLKYRNATGYADTSFAYGDPNDIPVTGDWNGDGITTVGIFRSGTWFLRNANGGGFADLPKVTYGDANDKPVVGDWDGNGTVTMGVYRDGLWLLKNDNAGGVSNQTPFLFGSPGEQPQTWR